MEDSPYFRFYLGDQKTKPKECFGQLSVQNQSHKVVSTFGTFFFACILTYKRQKQ